MKKLILVSLSILSSLLYFSLQKSETISNEIVTHEQRQDSPQEFITFHKGIRTQEGMTSPAYADNYQLKELAKARKMASQKSFAARTQSGNGVVEWKERGPSNVPGRTRGLLVDPDDATHNTWFAGSAGGGVWKTSNGGNTWTWLTPDLPNMATTALAMAASNHDIIYAGTGEGFGNLDGVQGHGIFKSTDRGATWSFLESTSAFGEMNRILIDPTNANIVLAASNKGIYRTINGGVTWSEVFAGVVQDLRATADNFNILFAARNGVGVLKSVNGGLNWSMASTGINSNGRIEIDISPVKTDRIFASAEGTLSGSETDLYISDNGGTSWSLVDMQLSNKNLNYLGSQGWYDNTIACDPYDKDIVYVGGIGLYKIQLSQGGVGNPVGSYSMEEFNTTSFINLVNFGAEAYQGKLDLGSAANKTNVEIRFGAGLSQKAHRFMVPEGATSGVADANYSYVDYVTVPFQVWDITTNRQLMVSFRDQDRNGVFNLYAQNTTSSIATEHSREYVFINNVTYDENAPNSSIAAAGGHQFQMMYNIWPTLTTDGIWNPNSLPTSALKFIYSEVIKVASTVTSAADPYAEYDGKNNRNFVHPDHHNIIAIKENASLKTFRLLIANDGGLFVSKTSTTPGIEQGDWSLVGNGFNTSQFYGADKRPGSQQYFGGMQDNSTYFSPENVTANASTPYLTNNSLAGDGFEVLWNNLDGKKMIGGSQFNNFSRSLDGGSTWQRAVTGLSLSGSSPDQTKFPFISKLANSTHAPDIIFTVGSEGVWKSTNFGGNWTLTPLTTNWGITSFADVEVSRANANMVWAGSGMSVNRKIFLSKDGGKTFAATNNYSNATLGSITKLASHPTENNTAFALFSFAKSPKILRTTDAGETWQDITGYVTNNSNSTNGFPDVAVYSVYVRPDDINIIWAGTEIGIVESLDGGSTWSLLEDFPNVPVWDMKGQDDEIVIATHGRGIWTAKLEANQAAFNNPKILALGTTPQSELMLKIKLDHPFDSTEVWVNSSKVGKLSNTSPGEYFIRVTGTSKGVTEAKLISFRGSAPLHSALFTGTNHSLKPYQRQYFNYFTTDFDFHLEKFSVQSFGSSNTALKTQSNYTLNSESIALLKQPIIVTSEFPFFIYRDVAIVEPGSTGSQFGQAEFKDYVVVEATKDGLTWIPIKEGYDATQNSNWLSAFNSSQVGSSSLFKEQKVDLTEAFSVGDTLLFRMRLFSDNTITAWGWAIDDLYIQQRPTGIENTISEIDLQVWPNPTQGKFNISYSLEQPAPVDILIYDVSGRTVYSKSWTLKSKGNHEETVILNEQEGIYLLTLSTSKGKAMKKILMKK